MNTTELLIANALETAKQLRELQESPVADAIFESIVENENGKEIQFERPISDLAFAAFLKIEALVEALESAQKSNAFLKDQLSELANFNPDWDKLEASYESWREIAAELLAAKGRIAELEGRAIKFPPKVERDDSDGYWILKGQRVSAANAAYYNEALKDVALALFAAGIKCEVKGE